MIRHLILTFILSSLKGENLMSNIKATNYLINLNWEKEIFEDLSGDRDDERAGRIFVYLFLSMKEILLRNGKQVLSGDSDIDYPVKGLISQILLMRGEDNTVSDYDIAQMKRDGMNSDQISQELKLRGIKLSASGVRMREGWKNYQNYI